MTKHFIITLVNKNKGTSRVVATYSKSEDMVDDYESRKSLDKFGKEGDVCMWKEVKHSDD